MTDLKEWTEKDVRRTARGWALSDGAVAEVLQVSFEEKAVPKKEVYVSIDIETDGPCPGLHNMLSLGAHAHVPMKNTGDGNPGYVDGPLFYNTIQTIPGHAGHPDTLKWWEDKPDAWRAATFDPDPPGQVMGAFASYIEILKQHGRPIAVAWPATFDFGFVNYYFHHFYGSNPLGFAALDIRSYANGLFHTPGYYEKIEEGDLYAFFGLEINELKQHNALDDAIRQGKLFMALHHYAETCNNARH